MPIDLDNLPLNENAYFYTVSSQPSKKKIEDIFKDALDDKYATRKYQKRVREPFIHGGKEIAKYPLDVYQFQKKPSFFVKRGGDKLESKFLFFLIIERGNYILCCIQNVEPLFLIISIIDYLNTFHIQSLVLLKLFNLQFYNEEFSD